MGKKKRKKPKVSEVSEQEYAALLARGGSASLDLITRYAAAVVADPSQAEQHGATQEQMLVGLAVLYNAISDEVDASARAAVGV